jgi:O-antigen/teichoic acid export membrane protein
VIDVTGTSVSVALAIVLSTYFGNEWVLCVQLASLSAIRLALMLLTTATVDADGVSGDDDSTASIGHAAIYGLRVMPLNLASYLSRSLDTGLLPGLVPAAAAGAYARSYQVVVTPLMQAQLSVGGAVIERLSRAARGSSDQQGALQRQLWRALLSTATLASIVLGLTSTLIAAVLFGPGWPMAEVFVAAMATVLPAIAVNMYFSWSMQIRPNAPKSVMHLGIVLISPLAVLITTAATGAIQYGLVAMVIAALLVPLGMIVLHKDLLPPSRTRWRVVSWICLAWVLSATCFVVVATLSKFWSFSQWG